jgi:hypothetical protein
MYISHHRDGAFAGNITQGIRSFRIWHSHPYYIAPGGVKLTDLQKDCGGVTGIGVAHRLHGHGSAPADKDASDINLTGQNPTILRISLKKMSIIRPKRRNIVTPCI